MPIDELHYISLFCTVALHQFMDQKPEISAMMHNKSKGSCRANQHVPDPGKVTFRLNPFYSEKLDTKF